jgi:hypothetical protein
MVCAMDVADKALSPCGRGLGEGAVKFAFPCGDTPRPKPPRKGEGMLPAVRVSPAYRVM